MPLQHLVEKAINDVRGSRRTGQAHQSLTQFCRGRGLATQRLETVEDAGFEERIGELL